MTLNWTTHRQENSTHSANDGVVTYWAVATGLSMQEVATAFLLGYDVSEENEGEAVVFSVTDLATEEDVAFSGLPNGVAA